MHQAIDTLSTVLLDIVHLLSELKDVVAFVSALPDLPPALHALLSLSRSMDLTRHWPCLYLENFPVRIIDLGITALPAFPHVSVGPATNLRWLAAPLPRSTRVRLPLRSRNDTSLAFARVWGDRVRHVSVTKGAEFSAHVHELLDLCHYVEHAIVRLSDPANAALWMSALARPAFPLRSLSFEITRYSSGPVDDCMPLACALLASPSLRTLILNGADDVHAALAALDGDLHSVKTFHSSSEAPEAKVQTLLDKLDPARVVELHVSQCVDISRFRALRSIDVMHDKLDPQHLTADSCPNLRYAFISKIPASDMPSVVAWLSTSQVLTNFQTWTKFVDDRGIESIAAALPEWLARGLEQLSLDFAPLNKQGLLLVTHAMTTMRNNPKRLKVKLVITKRALDLEETRALFTAVGSSPNVTLTVNDVLSYPQAVFPELAAQARIETDQSKAMS
ncbi:hypothetical protein SPRG_16841 [Saprolegnia parasitica CBS 223.65]|uniref:F-box domain-containing protein n=1 Tax=Saprolegnia parasitica (strain CBS 223.65) TaxID=695850 RepID=A0A067BHI2_SAPPC|nr:hypothetical protein SPRG_16841 [Saprolegnia parasitica CBS 223.65]KDO17638.1 hypothetical protein SPRG_16841 [Saprolegnia parasitica CBS 223.65]|eukprot:XP_012211656.1 hypothetical protein SPRG_16841 [Saprolegnia parasitica CBS 223.65]